MSTMKLRKNKLDLILLSFYYVGIMPLVIIKIVVVSNIFMFIYFGNECILSDGVAPIVTGAIHKLTLAHSFQNNIKTPMS